ncbi:MAG: VOC family protein [Dinoroseobacter sp.]|nr:VOC family protein [Dinoroseobacter sp.]
MSNALVPEFAVSDFAASKRFYCRHLGFACVYERPEDGFAYLALGKAELMIDQIGQGRSFDNGHLPRTYPFDKGVNVQIKVPAIAPMLVALDAAQWSLYLPPEERWYRCDDTRLGHRQFVVADPDGYLLRFYEPLGGRPIS